MCIRDREEAAILAAVHSSAYSKEMGGAKVAVDYTEVKNVWKANGAKPGMVLYDPYQTATVTPDEALAIGEKAAPWFHILEVGTPMVTAYGMEPVRRLRAAFPSKEILADVKIVDSGRCLLYTSRCV